MAFTLYKSVCLLTQEILPAMERREKKRRSMEMLRTSITPFFCSRKRNEGWLLERERESSERGSGEWKV